MEKLDLTDQKLLVLLQQNARFTIKDLAAEVNLSITPVHERIKRLETEGYIDKYVTLLNKKRLGSYLLVYCQLTLDKQTQNNFEEFDLAISKLSEVLECSVVSGGFDYLLKILVHDMAQYQVFYQTKLTVLPSVAHISSFFVMKEVKNTTEIPVKLY
jgi:Lrp/AsnC family transcriptional regulator, leucine-responsive regulatory protein